MISSYNMSVFKFSCCLFFFFQHTLPLNFYASSSAMWDKDHVVFNEALTVLKIHGKDPI